MTVDVDFTKDAELSQTAQDKAKELIDRENSPDLMLRISVQPGGCSGLRYQLFFDSRVLEEDSYVEYENGLTLAVDRMSRPYLMGATIDYVDSIEKQGFVINNPSAQGSCACGDSFH